MNEQLSMIAGSQYKFTTLTFVKQAFKNDALLPVIVFTLFIKLIDELIDEILEAEIVDMDKFTIEALLMQRFKEEIDTDEIKFCREALVFQ